MRTGVTSTNRKNQSRLEMTGSDNSESANACRAGLLITFEGGEGSGKTTQAQILIKSMQSLGFNVVFVAEPGTTELGKHVRQWIKRKSNTSPLAEALLFSAARTELVRKIVRPSIDAGRVVISDRFADSTLAYQGYGRDAALLGIITELNQIATGGMIPDITVLLDLEPRLALSRLNQPDFAVSTSTSSRVDDEDERRFEAEPIEFHTKVMNGYRKMAKAEPERWIVIDASRSVDEISDEIWSNVRRRLALA